MRNKDINFLTYSEAHKMGVDVVGGKAYSIAVLNENGIIVPKGVILPKEIWKQYETTKNEEFLKIIVDKIVDYIKADKYAVRSSAVGEDAKDLSWAGCFESILNISAEQLKDSIIECGKSLYGERVRVYKTLHNNIKNIEDIGILIQEYIDADWSGVCFSSNPVTGNDKECIIEYQKGKSGSVVGGYGESTTVIIDKNIGMAKEKSDMPSSYINTIYKKISKIYQIWKVPVDVEWVIKESNLYITQTRPITTIN